MSNEDNQNISQNEPDSAEPTEAVQPDAVPAEPVAPERREVAIRRAPKFSVFILLGSVLGLIVAAILTFSFPEIPGKTNWNQVFGFLFLPGATIGAAVGATVALILDRISRSKNRTGSVVTDHEHVDETEAEAQ